MDISVFTLFPEVITSYAEVSVLGRAQAAGGLTVRAHDIRDAATDVHRSVDDAPFGGGAGMVLAPAPIFDSVEAARAKGLAQGPLLLLTPSGEPFTQRRAEALAGLDGFSLLCGRYEGVDQRVVDHLVDDEISLGDFVLAGGELAALVVIEAVARLLPGTLGNEASSVDESFSDGLLEYPQYTRPAEFRGMTIPDVLRSGDHAKVARWRRAQALARTLRRRPDLIAARGGLTDQEVEELRWADEVHLLREHGYH